MNASPLAAFPVPLVCPRCRRVEEGRLCQARPEPHPAGLACPTCGAVYPVVGGVPVVLRDVDAWLSNEALSLLCPLDLPAPVLARVAGGAGGSLRRDLELSRVYRASAEGPLQSWVVEQANALAAPTLDVGGGLGQHGRESVVVMDLNGLLVRLHPGPAVVGDALDPPFPPESFPSILLVNLLDSCRDPALALAQAHALLVPGGHLVLTCAFAWQDDITPRSQRLSEASLREALDRGFAGMPMRFRCLEETELDWPLQVGDRSRHVHRTLCLLLEKEP